MPVRIDAIEIPVKFRKPKVREQLVWWPTLRMSDWIKALVSSCPEILLCGFKLEDDMGWKQVLSSFWQIYQTIDPNHCFFESTIPFTNAIPYYLHGDEGRGLRSKPFLVESFQPVIANQGLFETNEKGQLGYHFGKYSFLKLMHLVHITYRFAEWCHEGGDLT